LLVLTAAGVSLRLYKNNRRHSRKRKSNRKSQPRKVGAKMERLEKLKLILGIKGNDEDDLLNYLLESTEQKILNYCNLKELPAELENVLIEMTANKYRNHSGAKSINIGDTSVTFGDDSNDISKEHKVQLNRFRRLQLI